MPKRTRSLVLCLSIPALACTATLGCNPSDSTTPGATSGATTGAGGAQSTGTAGSTDGGITGANATTGGGEVLGGYYESGAWHGYAWTAPVGDGTSINPMDFSTLPSGSPYCVSGVVGPAADYSGVSLLGFNINQAQTAEGGGDPPIESAIPTGTGIAVNFSKTVASALRIQIQGPAGETDANDRWCYEIAEPAGPVFAPYAE